MENSIKRDLPCNFVIIGASGDLSRRKLIPALFSLYCNELLPIKFSILGFARTVYDDQEFRDLVVQNLTCRYEPESNKCAAKMEEFLARCFYVSGRYDDDDAFVNLRERLGESGYCGGNDLWYMAIPPSVFIDAAKSIKRANLAVNGDNGRWSRIVVEKPFGRDSDSSAGLLDEMSLLFSEQQIYRIDHYLGKEVIQNLMILRFANLIFEPLWNKDFITSVSISWSEKIGCAGRAGYFDNYGIIRDVIQNHLLQIVALVGMEQPSQLDAEKISDEKVRLLRSIESVSLNETVVGQYASSPDNQSDEPGYLDDPDVPDDSITPTYAKTIVRIANQRWENVPFYLEAGKALDRSMTEIRIQFREVPESIYHRFEGMTDNCLVIRVQPNEAIELHIVNKRPGFRYQLDGVTLNLHYASTFQEILPDAYERLLLDVIRGDRSLFIRADELAASWEIVTPVLKDLELQNIKPESYEFGSSGPNQG